jgi:hypothetical protein
MAKTFHNYMDYRRLTAKQRAELKKKLRDEKKALEANLKAVNQALRNLAKKR